MIKVTDVSYLLLRLEPFLLYGLALSHIYDISPAKTGVLFFLCTIEVLSGILNFHFGHILLIKVTKRCSHVVKRFLIEKYTYCRFAKFLRFVFLFLILKQHQILPN